MSYDGVQVSVVCNAYNHEKYIRDALEGFVSQQTTFPFEVLIHDDASADKTADIIREYEARYPDIIKPIYQSENRYSKGITISTTYQYPRVKGRYVAFCEGDDCWTDPLKLQKQFDLMEAHPEADICAHSHRRVDGVTGELISVSRRLDHVGTIPLENVIRGEGGYVGTCTLMQRTELLANMPEFRKALPLDYTMQVHGAMRGGMLYIPDTMAVYRYAVNGSWTSRLRSDSKKKIAFKKRMIKMLGLMDRETGKKYSAIIRRIRLREAAKIVLLRLHLIK